MAKQTFTIYLVAYANEHTEGGIKTALWTFAPGKDGDVVLLREVEIALEVPEHNEVAPKVVEAIVGRKDVIRAEAKRQIMELDNQIQSLLALPNANDES